MSLDRMLGGVAVIYDVFLLMYAIPQNVRSTGGLALNPALCPQVAAWLFIVLGALQMLLGTGPTQIPGRRELLRLALVTLLTLISLVAMQAAGFLVAMIGLMV